MRLLLALLVAALFAFPARAEQPALRVGLTPVFLDDRGGPVNAWRAYLEKQLKRPVQFVRRASYREIVDLLQQQKLEFAWLCGYPYVENDRTLALLAVPVYQGKPLYQSYVIVPARDMKTATLGDLKSRVFAYSDPNSNSGFLVVQDALRALGEEPAFFFRKTFFTSAHSKVIEAVSVGLADGGAVDGYVYDALAEIQPALVARTRVVSRSPYYGFPPIVARKDLSGADFDAMQRALLRMAADAQGKGVLVQLRLDGFTKGDTRLFDDIRRMTTLQRRSTHGS
jgi:phosphonate transport system substrate-binding protein